MMTYHIMLLVISRFLRDIRGKAGIGMAPRGVGNAWRSGVLDQGTVFTCRDRLGVSLALKSRLCVLSDRRHVYQGQHDLHTFLPGSEPSDLQALWPSTAIQLRVSQRIFRTVTFFEITRRTFKQSIIYIIVSLTGLISLSRLQPGYRCCAGMQVSLLTHAVVNSGYP